MTATINLGRVCVFVCVFLRVSVGVSVCLRVHMHWLVSVCFCVSMCERGRDTEESKTACFFEICLCIYVFLIVCVCLSLNRWDILEQP